MTDRKGIALRETELLLFQTEDGATRELGEVVELGQVGGLHHRYTRRRAA